MHMSDRRALKRVLCAAHVPRSCSWHFVRNIYHYRRKSGQTCSNARLCFVLRVLDDRSRKWLLQHTKEKMTNEPGRRGGHGNPHVWNESPLISHAYAYNVLVPFSTARSTSHYRACAVPSLQQLRQKMTRLWRVLNSAKTRPRTRPKRGRALRVSDMLQSAPDIEK